MKISVFGIGKLGLCFSLVLEEAGYKILGVDLNRKYVKSINEKTLKSSEPKVEEMLLKAKNLKATTAPKQGMDYSNIIYVFVSTPSLPDNTYDHSQIENIISYILDNKITDKILVIGCTVMPGYCQNLQDRLKHLNISVVYNPEFIAQGNIIHGLCNPDFVLIGESTKEAGDEIEKIYSQTVRTYDIRRMSLTSAEICKLALNCFITTKISFANSIGDLATAMGASPKDILSAIGIDERVGPKCLNYGYGFGGPCFPRDNRALLEAGKKVGIELPIPAASDLANNLHHQFLLDEAKKNKVTVFESLSYKPESILTIESQQLRLCEDLIKAKYKVDIRDKRPEVIEQLPKYVIKKIK